jgi:hypothetical protein
MHALLSPSSLTIANGHRTDARQLVLSRHERAGCAYSPTHLATHSKPNAAVYVASARPSQLRSLEHRHLGQLKNYFAVGGRLSLQQDLFLCGYEQTLQIQQKLSMRFNGDIDCSDVLK